MSSVHKVVFKNLCDVRMGKRVSLSVTAGQVRQAKEVQKLAQQSGREVRDLIDGKKQFLDQ